MMRIKISQSLKVMVIIFSLLPCLSNAAEPNETSSNAIGVMDVSAEASNDENIVGISVGYDHTTGTYGTKKTSNTLTVPVTLTYDTGNYGFALTVPYVRQTTLAGSIAGRRVIGVGSSNQIISQAGLGDATGAVTRYLFDDDETGISIDVKGEIKFATGDLTKGLGTGKNDYSVQLDVYKYYDNWGMSGTAGYSVLGSPGDVVVNGVQQNITLNNVYYGSIGVSYKSSENIKTGLAYDMQQAAEIGGIPQKDIRANLTLNHSNETSFHFYILKGLSDSSPDWGSGASVSTSF
jgi:hypothetical protein